MYINTTTLEYPIPYITLKKLFNNTCFPRAEVDEFDIFKRVEQIAPPIYDENTQTLVEGDPVLVGDSYQQNWEIVELSQQERDAIFADKKSVKSAQITAKRKEVEENHPTLDTSAASQQRIAATWIAMQKNNSRVINFKGKDGNWTALNKAAIEDISETVIQWVQDCFNNEKALSEAVDAATTLAELDAIDINSGWPT